MLSHRCNITKAINRAVCVAVGQLIMTSLAKQFTASQILSIMKLENLTQMCILQTPLIIDLNANVIRKRP